MKTRWMKKSLSLLLALVLCLSVLSPAALAAEDVVLPEEQSEPVADPQIEVPDPVPAEPEAQPEELTPVEGEADTAEDESAPADAEEPDEEPEAPAPTPEEPEALPEEGEADEEALPEEADTEETDEAEEPVELRSFSLSYINPLYADVVSEADLPTPRDLEHYRTALRDSMGKKAAAEEEPITYCQTREEASASFRAQFVARTAEIAVYYAAPSTVDWNEEIDAIFDGAMAHTGNPREGDYLSYQYGGWNMDMEYTDWNETTYYCCLIFTPLYYTSAAQESEMDGRVSAILGQLNLGGKSDRQKLEAIYAYLTANVVYDFDNLNNNDYKLQYTGYAALCNGTAVCQGISVAFYRLCLASGVDARVVSCDDMCHAWNIARCRGAYYALDATWDLGAKRPADYWYFLKGSTYWLSRHKANGISSLGDQYQNAAFASLYAIPAEDCNLNAPEIYSVHYDPNGGENAPGDQVKEQGIPLRLSTDVPTRDGFDFQGWALSAEADSPDYLPGANYIIDASVTLYAVWADPSSCTSGICGADGGNLTWTLEGGDTLIISGKGDMADFTSAAAPWYSYREAIRTLVVQPGVTSIGAYAFENCSALRRVELPNGLTRLGLCAFSFCSSLKEIQLPETLISIESMALNMTEVKSVYIPASVTNIAGGAFWHSPTLERFDVAPENQVYQSVDGIIFSKDGTQLLQYPDARQGAYTVPAGVTTIGDWAFYNSQGLTSVSFPDTLTSIGFRSFESTNISTAVFIPASVNAIAPQAFAGIPAPLTVAADNPSFTAVDGVLYSKDMKDLWAATWALEGSFVVPSSVTRIFDGAFKFAHITGLTIPRSVNLIRNGAFLYCDSLTEIRFEHLRDDPLFIDEYAFTVWHTAPLATNITAFFSDQVGMNETIASYDWAGAGRSVSFLPAPVQNHSVVYVLNGGTNSPANPEHYSSLDTVTLAAPTREGYAFAGWYASEDFSGDPVAVLSGGVPAAVYAKWSPIEYSIHFDPNGGSGTIPDLHGCETDARYPLPESGFTRTGYSLAGWNTAPDGSGAAYLPGEEVVNLCSVPDGSVTLYAVWTPNTYAIAFDGNGADGEPMEPMETLFGQNTALPPCSLSRSGYHFTGWNTRADGKGTAYADGVTVLSLTAEAGGVATLYAQWSPNAYTVRFDPNGGTGSMAAQAMTYDKEAALRANAFKKASHVFLGWATEPDALSPLYLDKQKVSNLTAAQNGELTLYAVWAKYSYQIVFNANGGSGDMADDGGFCEYDGVYTLPACGFTREGFDFLGWATSAKGKVVYQDGQSISGLSNKNGTVIKLYAVWQAHSYRVAFDGNGASSGSMKVLSCTCGKTYTLTANAFKRTGYTFAGWNTAPDGSGATYANKAKQMNFATESGALLTLYAQWTPTAYKITYKNIVAGDGNPNPETYTVESETIVLAPAFRPGCDFAGWFADAKFKTPVTEIAAGGTGARTLYAKWIGTANTYGIVFDPNGGTGTTKAMAKLSCGKAYALTANAFKRAGYTFAGWNTAPDGSGAAYANKEKVANLSVEDGGSVTLFAQWTPVVYKITYKNALYDGNTNPATFTPESETIVLAPVSRAGCVFGGWFTDAKFKTPITEIATGRVGNLTLYAKWTGKAATYTIAFDGNGASSGKMKDMTKRACGSAYALTANAFKRTGYSFAGWNTAPDGSGAAYANKEKVANLCEIDGGTATLYAQWTPIAYTISYKNIGPALTPEKTSYTVEEGFELPTPVKVGHVFLGWYSTAAFKAGTQVQRIEPGTTGNLTLYAKWMLLRG